MFDLFSDAHQGESFNWVVAMFAGSGAVDAIRRANDIPLKTYFPIRFNGSGIPVPLWRNYLFIEFREVLTLQLCRNTGKLLKILSMRDEDGKLAPVLLRKNVIDENLGLMIMGKFNDKTYLRRFYGRGSVVRVIEGTFIDKRVKLDMDIEPHMQGNRKVIIDINGVKGSIELWKLAL